MTGVGSRSGPKSWQQVFLVGLYAAVVAAFFVLRYQGGWLEGDTSRLIQSTSSVLEESAIAPESDAYGFGFNYPVLSAILALVVAVPPGDLLTLVRPFFVIMVAVAAFVLYGRILPGRGLAALAAMVLLIQPEFLFVNLRGSHEAITWLLVIVALYLLMKGTASQTGWAGLVKYAGLFYLIVFALVTTSYFFATSFIIGLSLSFLGGVLLTHVITRDARKRSALLRLAYIASACAILVFLFVFYLYAPAHEMLRFLRHIADKVAAFAGSFDVSENPYEATLGRLWPSPYLYLALSLANWLTLGASFVMWLSEGWGFLRARDVPELSKLVPWLFYAAFAFQLALSVVLDLAGVLSGNLQLRLFPAIIVVGVPYATLFCVRLLRAGRRLPRPVRVAALALGLVLLAWLAAASLLKSATEPLVSNMWSLHSSSEEAGLEWVQIHTREPALWVGLGERLRELGRLLDRYDPGVKPYYDLFRLEPETRYVLWSDITEMRATRLRVGLPDVRGAHVIYDNGESQVFHFRPRTPFQK